MSLLTPMLRKVPCACVCCLLYTSDAADGLRGGESGGGREVEREMEDVVVDAQSQEGAL